MGVGLDTCVSGGPDANQGGGGGEPRPDAQLRIQLGQLDVEHERGWSEEEEELEHGQEVPLHTVHRLPQVLAPDKGE